MSRATAHFTFIFGQLDDTTCQLADTNFCYWICYQRPKTTLGKLIESDCELVDTNESTVGKVTGYHVLTLATAADYSPSRDYSQRYNHISRLAITPSTKNNKSFHISIEIATFKNSTPVVPPVALLSPALSLYFFI